MRLLTLALVCGITTLITSCATNNTEVTKRSPGFLTDYSILKPVANTDDGVQIYVYNNPNVKRTDYSAAIVNPVILYQRPGDAANVSRAQIESARYEINQGVKQLISKEFTIVSKPGPGVFAIQVAITGATLEKDSLKIWNLIPISAAIRLASTATGFDNKTPVLVVEIKIVDSRTKRLLKEIVSTINGETFRNQSHTAQEFTQLASKWVQQALKYADKSVATK